MEEFKSHLEELKSNTHNLQTNNVQNLIDLLKDLNSNDVIIGIQLILELILSDNVSLIVSRQSLLYLKDKIFILAGNTKSLFLLVLDLIQSRLISFEEQASEIRISLANEYENEQNWKQAADILAGIPLETGQKSYSKEYKLKTYIRIANMYLKADEDQLAENIINRAAMLLPDIKDDDILLQYKQCCSIILDARKKYLEAAQRYLELSYKLSLDDERMIALKNSINCAILSPAGLPRSKTLAILYKDERCKQLQSFCILEKMYLDRIIRPEELKVFESELEPHHKILDSDGVSILEKAVMQHNLLSASNIYMNIAFDQLALLLNVSEDQAENLAAKMISENRLEAKIDQITRFLYFGDKTEAVDRNAYDLCCQLNNLYEKIELIRQTSSSSPLPL